MTDFTTRSEARRLRTQQQAFSHNQHRMANEPENRLPESSGRVTEASGRQTFLQRFEALSNQARLAIHWRVASNPHINFMPFDYYVHDEVEFILEEEGVINVEPRDNSLREGLITANHPNRHNATVARHWAPRQAPVANTYYQLRDAVTGEVTRIYIRRDRGWSNFDRRQAAPVQPPQSVVEASIEAGQPREANEASYLSINWIDGPFIRLLRRAQRRIRFLRRGQILPSHHFESDMIRNINRNRWPLAAATNNPLRLRVRSTALGRAFAVAALAAVAA